MCQQGPNEVSWYLRQEREHREEQAVAKSMTETLRAYERLPLYKRQEHAKTMGWPIPTQ